MAIGDAMDLAGSLKAISSAIESLRSQVAFVLAGVDEAKKAPQSVSELQGKLLVAFRHQTARIEALEAKVNALVNPANQSHPPLPPASPVETVQSPSSVESSHFAPLAPVDKPAALRPEWGRSPSSLGNVARTPLPS